MDNNINENENVQESFTQQDIERLATEKFEQYKYELECNNYLEKNNIPKEIKDIIRFDNMEMLEKNITTLKEIFGQSLIPGLTIESSGATPGSSNTILKNNKNNMTRKAFGLN